MHLRLRRRLLTGLFIVMPLVVTIWFLKIFFTKAHGWISPWLRRIIHETTGATAETIPALDWIIPLAGFLLTLVGVYLLGLVAAHVLGRRLLTAFDRLMLRIPLIKTIYGSAKQIMDAFRAPSKRAFEEVVLVPYPTKGSYAIGFRTSAVQGPVAAPLATDHSFVFVPTTPNPTSGFLLLVRNDEIVPVDLTIDAAFKVIVSAGLVKPAPASAPPD